MAQILVETGDYAELIDNSIMLECLKAAGVDNWEGYSDAIELYNKALNDDQE